MPKYNFIVFTNPSEGQEDEFNRWYDDVHVPEVIATPGFTGASRFRLATPGVENPEFRYLAIYEIETDDAAATLAELTSRAGDGRFNMSTALGNAQTMLFEEITPFMRAPGT